MWPAIAAALVGLLAGYFLARKKKPRALVAPDLRRSIILPRSSSSIGREAGWEELVELLDDAVCMIDKNGNVLRANRAFAARAGVAGGNMRGVNLAPLIDPRSPAKLAQEGPIALALRTNRPASGTAGPCRFGAHVRLTAMPLATRLDAIAVAIQDLTDVRGQEDRVRHLGHLVGELPVVVVEADPVTHQITFANSAFAECFGATSDDAAIGLSVDELYAGKPGERARFPEGTSSIAELARQDGSEFFARIHSRLIRKASGAPETLVLMIEDITREREATRQRELLAAAVEASKDGIVITDLQGKITYANAAARALYQPQLLGCELGGLHRGHPSQIDLESGWTGDLMRTAGDESLRPTRVTVAAVHPTWDEGGSKKKAVAYVAILHDITDEREMQEQVLRSQKLATLGEVAATLNHEISNPLTFLLANTSHVSDQLARSTVVEQELKNAAREAVDGAERIQAIVSEVRRFAHMGKGGRSAVSFQSVIESALALCTRRVSAHALVERLSGPPIDVFVDPGQLTQVILNLIVNAAQAFEDAQKKGTIRFEQGIDGELAYLRVIDDGPGIPDSVRERLFRDYVTTKEPGRGTGFGLRISQKLLEANDGAIRVDSTLGLGTTFTLQVRRATRRRSESGQDNIPSSPARTDPSWSAFEKRLQVALTGATPTRR